MKPLLQYKKSAAFILLLLQVFISTPVQFYHHHTYASDNIKHAATVSEICPVCNHQYTAYYNDYVFKGIIIFKQPVTAHYTIYKQSLTSALVENPSNKSPPLTYLM